MNVVEFLDNTLRVKHLKCGAFEYEIQRVRDRAICQDGFTVSIQHSGRHYCSPRVDQASVYATVELGYPDMLDDELVPYAETPGTRLTVFPCVPIDVVQTVLNKHGGLVGSISDDELRKKRMREKQA